MNEIFDNQSEVIENIKDSAENLGFDVGRNKTKEELDENQGPVLVAKRNCKMCWGKGWVTCSFPGNDGKGDSKNFYCTCVKPMKEEGS